MKVLGKLAVGVSVALIIVLWVTLGNMLGKGLVGQPTQKVSIK